MKKILKTIAGITLAGTLVVGAGALSACSSSDTTYNGQYNYANPYSSTSPDYGIKVRVDVQSDSKGDRIKSVQIIDSVYTEASDSNLDYGWDNTVWFDGLDTLLNNYRGKYISDVLVQTVSVNASGVPTSLTDDEYLISGSTQGSGRLLLAVQNALADAAEQLGYKVYSGEYHYANFYDSSEPDYGIKVKLVTKKSGDSEVIQKVAIVPSDYIEASASNTAWGWDNSVWYSGLDSLLAKYEGKTVEAIQAVNVTVSATGEPSAVSDETYVTTGSTQGSGRLMLAIQAALRGESSDNSNSGNSGNTGSGDTGSGDNEAENYTTVEGEYHYTNPYGGNDYGIKIKVKLLDGVIKEVTEVSSDYTSVTSTWADKDIWTNGLDSLLAKYQDKTVEEVLSVYVTCDAETVGSGYSYSSVKGQPSTVSDDTYVTTGSTQGSGRLLLAVQDALKKLDGYEVTDGEYHYTNPYGGNDYGIKARVVLKDGVVKKLTEIPSDYVSVTSSWADKDVWTNGLSTLLSKYEGKTVEELLSVYVTCDAETVGSGYSYSSVKGQPSTVSDDNYVTSGSTQGSGRLMLAVQDALKKLDGYEVTEGEYHYANPYGGNDYGIKVRVVLKDDVIKKVVEIPSDYTSVTSSWADKDVWINGLDSLLAKYEGKTASDIYAVTVTYDTETVGSGYSYSSVKGQPSAVSDTNYITTGSTQGSGRLMLAVQDALYKLYGTPATSATQYTDNIDLTKTTYKVDGDVVKYTIVTGTNSPAGAFTIKVSVGADQKITSFEIVTNGSTSSGYANAMYDVSNYVGKTLAELEAINSGNTLSTGATKSNTLTISAALFAVANYTALVG